jgi:hypothetical protein
VVATALKLKNVYFWMCGPGGRLIPILIKQASRFNDDRAIDVGADGRCRVQRLKIKKTQNATEFRVSGPNELELAKRAFEAGARIRFGDLVDEEKAAICNGCGGKGGWFNPPDYRFTASCDHHDFQYWLGWREEDRAKADAQFRAAMLRDARRAPWWGRWWSQGAAWRYYWAVRICGKKHFHYGLGERTVEDLDREMGRIK